MVSKSSTETRVPQVKVVMMPKDTNHLGNIFGGVILSHLDLAAAEHAKNLSKNLFVTKVIKEVNFIAPVNVGDTVSFYCETKKLGKTSLSISVDVEAARGLGKNEIVSVTSAEVIMVAIDEKGKPTDIELK